MSKKNPFHSTLSKSAASGTNEISTDPVLPGRLYCYQRIGVLNQTSPFTRLRIIIRTGAGDFISSEHQAPQADQLYWDDMPIYLTQGQELVIEMTGCAAADVLRSYLSGWWQQNGKVS